MRSVLPESAQPPYLPSGGHIASDGRDAVTSCTIQEGDNNDFQNHLAPVFFNLTVSKISTSSQSAIRAVGHHFEDVSAA